VLLFMRKRKNAQNAKEKDLPQKAAFPVLNVEARELFLSMQHIDLNRITDVARGVGRLIIQDTGKMPVVQHIDGI